MPTSEVSNGQLFAKLPLLDRTWVNQSQMFLCVTEFLYPAGRATAGSSKTSAGDRAGRAKTRPAAQPAGRPA